MDFGSRDQELRLLMERSQEGDRSAYTELLSRIYEVLKSYLGSRLSVGADLDDLLQEILTSVHKGRNTYIPGRPFGPWLFAIARNRLRDHLRSRRKNRADVVDTLEEHEDELLEPQVFGEYNQVLAQIRELLADMPDRYRDVVRLTKLEGYSMKEAADRLQCSEGAARVLAHRAYRLLRDRLTDESD